MKIKNLNLYMNVLKVVLVATGVILSLFLFGGPNAEADKAAIREFRDGSQMGLASIYTGFIFFLGIGLILLFFVIQLITNPKKTVLSILGLLLGFAIFMIFWMMGSSDTNETLQLRHPVEQSTIASTSAGLWTALVAVGVAAFAVISSIFIRFIR